MLSFYTLRKHLKPKVFMIFLGVKENNINLNRVQEHLQLSNTYYVHFVLGHY